MKAFGSIKYRWSANSFVKYTWKASMCLLHSLYSPFPDRKLPWI